jgi:alanyl-tRNA synthetase
LTGEAARVFLTEQENQLNAAAVLLKARPDEVSTRIAALIDDRRRLERELADARRTAALGGGKSESPAPEQIGGTGFVGQVIPGLDAKNLRGLVDDAKKQIGSGIVVLVAVNDGRATVAIGVTGDQVSRYNAVDLVKIAAAAVGGQGGGGRPDMAQAGGPDGARANAAIDAVRAVLTGMAAAA